MSLPAIFENFVKESPVSIMMRGTLERVMSPFNLDQLFEKTGAIKSSWWSRRAIAAHGQTRRYSLAEEG